jgi:carbon monoxide dehydrogenase subunit G
MKISGEQIIPQAQQLVWESLNDPEVLQACIPGCEAMEKIADNKYEIAMLAAIGPFKAKFKGELELSEIQAPNSYKLNFSGSGGAVGFGKGNAEVVLTSQSSSTLLQYESTAQMGGKLAQIGSRLVGAAAKKISDDFFQKFRNELARRYPANSGESIE